MKLKFTKTTAAGRVIYHAGETYEVKDRHAAEVYLAHGYAVVAPGEPTPGRLETLERKFPVVAPQASSAKLQAPIQEAGPAASK